MAMSSSGLDHIERAVQSANLWLSELDGMMGWEDRRRTWRLLRSVLHALRDWLPVNEAADLGAQLPTLIRGIYYEGWQPAHVPVKPRTYADFRARIEKDFTTDPPDDPADYIHTVFRLLCRHVTEGEMEDVRRALPEDIRSLFPRS
jgi:uncharacterized protein (DUF2267 family)